MIHTFPTHLFTHTEGADEAIQGLDWKLTFEPNEQQRFRMASSDRTTGAEVVEYARQLHVSAPTERDARYVTALVIHAQVLQEGLVPHYYFSPFLNREAKLPVSDDWSVLHAAGLVYVENLRQAAVIASRIAREDRLQYALFKHTLCRFMHSVTPIAANPPAILKGDRKSRNSFEVVLFNSSIFNAYSALEELGFEVRPTKDQSRSRTKEGLNPVLLSELIERLQAENIDINEKIAWIVDGDEMLLNKKFPPPDGPAVFPSSGSIEARHVDIARAIFDADRLRDRVATHRMNDESKSISISQVFNCQNLARRLLLERIGCWKGWGGGQWIGPTHPQFGRPEKMG